MMKKDVDQTKETWDNALTMAKRILNVTVKQYTTLEANGVLECGHFAWMTQHEITHVLHPSRGKLIAVTSSYPAADRVKLIAVTA